MSFLANFFIRHLFVLFPKVEKNVVEKQFFHSIYVINNQTCYTILGDLF